MNRELINEAISLVKKLMQNNDPSHDWHHVDRVYKNACYIAQQESQLLNDICLDMKVIELAALFHDVVDFKYDHDKSNSLEEIAKERLNTFFDQYKSELTSQQIEKIIYIILNISWRKELENKENQANVIHELKIVRDADRLESIGAIGIARLFAYSGSKRQSFYDDAVKPELNITAEEYNRRTLNNEILPINYFQEKLLLIKKKLMTETGKRLAEDRHDFLMLFLNQFDKECHLKNYLSD